MKQKRIASMTKKAFHKTDGMSTSKGRPLHQGKETSVVEGLEHLFSKGAHKTQLESADSEAQDAVSVALEIPFEKLRSMWK